MGDRRAKVRVSAADALDGLLHDGMRLAAGGFGLCGIPENLIAAVVASSVTDLTIIGNNAGVDDFGMGLLLPGRQVRRIVRWEAVITALIGGVLGCVVGLALSVLFIQPLDGFKLSIPFGQLIVLIVLAGVAGVLAAVWPARRAAKLDVLEALAYE